MEQVKYITVTVPSSGRIRTYPIIEGEAWKPIIGFETLYEVSNFCRVRSLHKRWEKHSIRILTGSISATGYHTVCLKTNEGEYTKQSHRLMAEAWIPNPDNKPQINHKNGIKTDNRIENLEWVTPHENVKHGYDTGLHRKPKGELNHWALLSNEQVLEIFNSSLTHTEIAKIYNISKSTVSKITTGKNWPHLTGKELIKKEFFSPQTILDIFNSTIPVKELAIKYNTHEGNIYCIKTGKNWSNITGKEHIPKFRQRHKYNGQIMALKEICRIEGVKFTTVTSRMKRNMTLEEALNTHT